MNTSVIVPSLAYAAFLFAAGETAAQGKTRPPVDKGVFVHLEKPSSSALAPAHFLLASAGILDSIAASLNRRYLIPGRIDLTGKQCGSTTGGYAHATHSVVVCFELVEVIRNEWLQLARPDQQGSTTDHATQLATTFVIHHEIGHALIDVLQIPTVGREEDAADQFATVVQLEMGNPEPVNSALFIFGAWATRESTGALVALGDAHELHVQRMLNLVCWLYGSGAQVSPPLLSMLPETRRAGCHDEFSHVVESWTRLLAPYSR